MPSSPEELPQPRGVKRPVSLITPSAPIDVPDPKRPKLSDEAAEALPEVPGITWSTQWSDLSLVVSTGEDAKPLARLPVHRFMVSQFTVIERSLSQPFNATCRSLDMSTTAWGATAWVRLFDYVYKCPIRTGEGGEQFASHWTGEVDSVDCEEVIHLVLYLSNSNMEQYIQAAISTDGPISPSAVLAFYLYVSPSEVDNLRTFASSRNLAGNLPAAKQSVEQIFNWLFGPGKLGPQYDWLESPTETQIRMCQWLFLLVATASSHDPAMSVFFDNMRKIASWLVDGARSKFVDGWFCKVTTLLLEFAPCIDHYNGRLLGNQRAPCLSLHRSAIVHSLYREGIVRADDEEIQMDPLFSGGLIWWRWAVDYGEMRRRFFMAFTPVSLVWTVRTRGIDLGDHVPPNMRMVCNSFRLCPVLATEAGGDEEKEARVVEEEAEEEEEKPDEE